MSDVDTTAVSAVELRGYRRGALSTDGWDQYVVPILDRTASFAGRALSFQTPGRGATTQRLLTLHNAAGSAVLVNVNRLRVDVLTNASKLIGSVPPVIRAQRFTTAPTGGTALTKNTLDSAGISNASVTVTGDASAENTLSGTALACTPTGVLEQVWGPRILGATTAAAAQYEMLDVVEFLVGETDLTLRAGEGMVISLENAAAAGNLAADRWVCGVDWVEYTQP